MSRRKDQLISAVVELLFKAVEVFFWLMMVGVAVILLTGGPTGVIMFVIAITVSLICWAAGIELQD